jgi:hypothetical protein
MIRSRTRRRCLLQTVEHFGCKHLTRPRAVDCRSPKATRRTRPTLVPSRQGSTLPPESRSRPCPAPLNLSFSRLLTLLKRCERLTPPSTDAVVADIRLDPPALLSRSRARASTQQSTGASCSPPPLLPRRLTTLRDSVQPRAGAMRCIVAERSW